jgi:hypothetical protein
MRQFGKVEENSAAPTSLHVGSGKPMDEAIEWQLLAHDEIFLHRKNRSQQPRRVEADLSAVAQRAKAEGVTRHLANSNGGS